MNNFFFNLARCRHAANYALWPSFFLFLFTIYPLSNAQAQNNNSLARLKLPSTARTVPNLKLESSQKLSEELKVETVDELIQKRRRYEEIGMLYHGLLALEDSLNVSLLSELEEDENLAQSVFLYQSAREMGDLIMDSPTGLSVRKVVDKARHLKKITSFRVEHNHSGGLLMKGYKAKTARTTPIAEFSFHLSARRGAEPRVTFFDEVILSYNIFAAQALVEYELDF